MIDPLHSQKGAVLIILIVAIVLGGLVGGAVYTLTATSAMNELTAAMLNRAQFLAEAGLRYATSQSMPSTPAAGRDFFLAAGATNPAEQFNVSVTTGRRIQSIGMAGFNTPLEARKVIVYDPAGAGSRRPRNNVAVISTFESTAAIDTSLSGTKIRIKEYMATGGDHLYWLAFVGVADQWEVDPENSNCRIGYHWAPLKYQYTGSQGQTLGVKLLRDDWIQYGTVSYDIQAKNGWYVDLSSAVSGINFRWHESQTAGKFQGYGLSFMVYETTTCNTTGSYRGDYIPNSIKPYVSNPGDLAGELLLVFWKQYVVGGVERKKWLAYARFGNPTEAVRNMEDPKVVGNQASVDGILNDNAALVVRTEDMILFDGRRVNDIKLFYGDASNVSSRTTNQRGLDAECADIYRARYSPQWVDGSLFPRWPSNYLANYSQTDPTFAYWTYPPWTGNADYSNGYVVIPLFRSYTSNDYSYQCIRTGRSGLREPLWPLTHNGLVNDINPEYPSNYVTWQRRNDYFPGTTAVTNRYDYFTLVSENPAGSPVPVRLYTNPAAPDDLQVLADGATIRTSDFLLATFPATRKELALHGMGLLRGSNAGIAFDDLVVQILGVNE